MIPMPQPETTAMNKQGEPPVLDGVLSETRGRLVDGESACDPETLLDLLAALLADEDEVGGSGLAPGQTFTGSEAGSTPLFLSRLDRARDCLQLLKLAWSRAGGPSEPEPATPAAGV